MKRGLPRKKVFLKTSQILLVLQQFELGHLAEGEGFEPSIRFYPYSELATRRTRPLCDPSVFRHSIKFSELKLTK